MVTRVLPLPQSTPLDPSTRAAWEWWVKAPAPHTLLEASDFWGATPPLTVPQLVALRLGRRPDRVSYQAARRCAEAFQSGARRGQWASLPLRRYPAIWDRTHSSYTFRLDPSRTRAGRRRPTPGSVLGRLLAWATPEDELELRFVMAALPPKLGLLERTSHALRLLRRGVASGFVVDLRRVAVPHEVWRPGPAQLARLDLGHAPRWRPSALEHGALAVEAALWLAEAWQSVASITALRSEADLMSRARAGRRRVSRVGDRPRVRPVGARVEAALPDLEITMRGGAYYAVEILSDSYRDQDMAEKVEGLSPAIQFVSTSRQIAERAARLAPRITHRHF